MVTIRNIRVREAEMVCTCEEGGRLCWMKDAERGAQRGFMDAGLERDGGSSLQFTTLFDMKNFRGFYFL